MADEQSDPGEDTHWDLKYRSEEEMEFFTEMALHETQRWIEAVTRQKFHYPDDPRKSLENGVLLCELLNCLKPSSVKKINRFPTPLAGLDNVNVFLEACRNTFGLTNTQLFDSCELQDLSQRAIADKTTHLKEENDRRLRNVAVTIFFLGKSVIALNFKGPQIDPNAFAGLFEHQHVDLIPEKTSAYSSSWESKRLQSNKYFSKSDQFSGSSGIGSRYTDDDQHIGDSSYESIGSKGSDDNQSICSDGMPSTTSGIYHFGDSLSSLQQSKNFDSDIYHSSPNLYDDIRKSPASADSADAMSSSSHSCQSSGSVEGSTQRKPPMQRGVSVSSNDPLQFIKPKSNPLVETAQKQISLSEKNKVTRNSVSLENEEDWYQNFASWKSRRQSRKSISVPEEPDETSQVTKRSTKTFKEMVEDREKRKSFKNFNSLDDGTENNSLPASDSFQNENVSRKGDATTVSETSISSKRENTVIKNEKSDAIEDNSKNNRSNRTSGNYNNNAASNTNNNNITDNFEDDVFAANTTEEPVLKLSEVKSVESVRSPRTKNDVEANNLKNIEQTARLEEKQQPLPSVESPSLAPPPPSSPPDSRGKQQQQLLQNELPHQSKSNELHSESGPTVSSTPVERISSPRPDKVDSSETDEGWIKDECEDFVERTIKISQSLRSEKGFGFLIRGGVDQNSPIVVHRIELGSAADICELRPRDLIVSINREAIQQHTQQKVQQIIDRANQQGQIELRVRRYLRGATYNEEDQSNISDKDVVVAKPVLTVNSSQSVPVLEEEVTKETKKRANYAAPTTRLTKTELSPEKSSSSVSSPTPNMQIKADLDNNNNESISVMKTTVTQSAPLINLEISEAETSNFPKATHQPHQRSASSDSGLAASSLSSSPVSSSSSTSIQPPALLRRWQNSKTKNQRPSSSDLSISPKSDDTNFETEPKTEAPLNSTFPPRHSVNLETPPLIQTRKRSDSCDQLLFQVRDIRSYAREKENTSRTATFLPKLDNQVRLQTTTAKDQPATENLIEKVEKNSDNFSAPLKIQIPPQIPVSTSHLQIDPKNQMPQATMNNKGSNLPEYNFNVELTYGEKVADRSSDDEGKIYRSLMNNSSQLLTSPSRDGEEDEDEEDEAAKEQERIEEREQAALDAQKRTLEEQRMIAQERQLIEEEKKKRLQEQQQRKEAEEKRRLQEKEVLLQHEKEQLEKEKQRIEEEKQRVDEDRRMLQEQKQQLEEEKKMMHRASLSGTIEKAIQQPSFSAAQPLHSDSSRTMQPLSSSPSRLSTTSNSKYVAPRPRASSDAPLKSSPVQISPQTKLIRSTKMESAVSRFSKNEPDPKESQRLTREDLLAMNRKPTPMQEKPEFNSNLPHHVSPIKREPPSKTELHSLNAVPKARHRDPKEWMIAPENSDAGRKPAPWLANRKFEFSPSSPSYSSSPSSSSVSKEYSQASQHRSPYPVDNVPKYNNGGLRQEGLPKESQVGSQSHWMAEKSEQRRLSDHWTEGKEEPWKGPSDNRAVRPAGDRSSYSQRDPTFSKVGIKPYVYKQTSKFSPVTPAISQSTENTLKSTNYRHSYASYEDSVRPYDGLSHGYSSSNLSTAGSYSPHTSNPYGSTYTKNNNSARPFQGQGGITGFQQRDNSAATKLPNARSMTSLSSDKTEQVSVTGVEICSHCHEKLMNTASMAIETLGLYYHVKCFHCSVCRIQLGNGTEGTDVRIRHNKLHCQNCYSCSEGELVYYSWNV
ncbi:LIM and calponin homology domains-containing protein 1-like isoform X3 [Octopus sinensis]|uniref:LIM and calponin homology domains-containing protein 1-like isoform X3 n=1 Tax=Octopus sinensis TaxID=2607531 RepID=A0A6P7SVT3_9MOLL|nr:LIM and calponin homology domains-containing protein 1-like isoform X3 [Octopus sinensis]